MTDATPANPTPPPGYHPPQPQKKKHTARNILLVLVVLFILFVGGCFALVGTAVNEADKAIKEEQENDKPQEVAAGKAFTHDDFQVAAGWKVAKDDLGGATIKGLKVTNDSDEARTAMLSFRFYKGAENLGEVECSSNEIQGGESSAMDCFSLDDGFPTGYTVIKVADSW